MRGGHRMLDILLFSFGQCHSNSTPFAPGYIRTWEGRVDNDWICFHFTAWFLSLRSTVHQRELTSPLHNGTYWTARFLPPSKNVTKAKKNQCESTVYVFHIISSRFAAAVSSI